MDSEVIKNWIKENLNTDTLPETKNLPQDQSMIIQDDMNERIKNLETNYDLRDIPLKEVILGKKILQRIRKSLQREIRDWTLSPYLEKQTLVNFELITILNTQLKIIRKLESSLEKLTTKQDSMESNFESLHENFLEILNSKISEHKKKSVETYSSIKNLYLNLFERTIDSDALDYYFLEIQNDRLSIDKLKDFLKNSEEYLQLVENKEILKKYQSKIKKPIFIIGVPRTGTTLIQNILSANKKLAWFSDQDIGDWMSTKEQYENYSYFQWLKSNNKKIAGSENQIFALGIDKNLNPDLIGITTNGTIRFPIEGEIFWKKYFGFNYIKNIPTNTKILLSKEISKLIKSQGKERFISKAPQNCMRLFALQKCFPDAKFINVARDPREVISSMIVRNEKEGTFDSGIYIKNKMKYDGLEFFDQLVWLYKEITDSIYEFFIKNKNNCMTVRYEDLISNPTQNIKKIFEFVELDIPNNVSEIIPKLKDSSKKWKKKISLGDEEKIFNILGKTIQKMDYPYSL